MKLTIPAPFPAVSGDVTMADDDSVAFVSDDGAISLSGLAPAYKDAFTAPDLRAALDAGTITAYSKIVAFNPTTGGIAIDLKTPEQWIATVTVPVE